MYYVNIANNTFNISPLGEVLEGFTEVSKEKFDELFIGVGHGKVILDDLTLTSVRPTDFHQYNKETKEWYLPKDIDPDLIKIDAEELEIRNLLPLSPLKVRLLFLELGKNIKEILDDLTKPENIKIAIIFDEGKNISYKNEVISDLVKIFKLSPIDVLEKWKDIQNRKF